MNCSNVTTIIVAIVVLILLIALFMQNGEHFLIGPGYLNSSPYYTTTFQAYPEKYMNYNSTRNSYCLQQHPNYSGYRNCMLYLE